MNIEVTSVSRKEQKLFRTPAAIYVITREAIGRSGATNIPELLRIVPGVQVAQVEAGRWAISVRGFNGVYSNKLLVLVDGRSVYTPVFSGVYWDQINMPLDTIERIEVVRGPGGTIWGANAVNGVINIISRKSEDSQGGQVSAGAGSFHTGDYQARFGGSLGHSGAYRAFGGYTSMGNLETTTGQNAYDGWHETHAGLRLDEQSSSRDHFTVETNGTGTDGGTRMAYALGAVPGSSALLRKEQRNTEFDVLGRWTHTHSDESESSLQISGSKYSRQDVFSREHLSTFDIDFQNSSQINSRNSVVVGVDYRLNSDYVERPQDPSRSFQTDGVLAVLDPAAKAYSLFSAFIQDEFLLHDNLTLTAGSKVEHNAFTGFEYEPSVRLAWTPNDSTTIWAAVSRAVRQPSRLDTALTGSYIPAPIAPGVFIQTEFIGNPQLGAEHVLDYEAGYRASVNSRFSFDLTGFYSNYKDLVTLPPQSLQVTRNPAGLLLLLPVKSMNGFEAHNYGLEANATWNVVPRWKLTTAYSWLQTDDFYPPLPSLPLPAILLNALNNHPGLAASPDRVAPPHQVSVQSYVDLSSRITLDTSAYYVGRLSIGVPAYTRVDTRLGWRIGKNIEWSLVGQNLLQPRHLEYIGVEHGFQSLMPRSVFSRLVWSF